MLETPEMNDEVRGSAPVMSAKDLLLEVYHDMKFVRPAVQGLVDANLTQRVDNLERDHIARDSQGGAPYSLVTRLQSLEDERQDRATAGVERRRIGDLSTRTVAAIVLVSNFLLGLIIMLMNLIQSGTSI